MVLLDGKLVSQNIKAILKNKVAAGAARGLRKPHLAAVIVGNDAASRYYIQSKIRSCAEADFDASLVELPDTVTLPQLILEIEKLNKNPNIDGYIVQLPLPKHIDEATIINAIDPSKDVDGFHPINQGKLALNQPTFIAATPKGVLSLLEYYNIKTKGKHAVVLGRSHIVGMPIAQLLSQNRPQGNCTVTLCHSHTKDLKSITQQADLLIAAIGKPCFVTEDMLRQGAVVIDVGINRVPDNLSKSGYKLVGDVDFEHVKNKCSYITPVPGGVGLMTVASLMQNTMQAWEQRHAQQ